MRILNITNQIPYPVVSGAPLHSYNLLRRLAREHQVWLAAFAGTPEQAEGITHMQGFCEGVETVSLLPSRATDRPLDFFRYMLKGRPPDLRFTYSKELASKIGHLVSTVHFDVVLLEHTEMGLYLEALPPKLHNKTVWSLHDVDWIKYARISRLERKLARRLRLWLHSWMLRCWNPRYAERFGRCLTVSESDRRFLIKANSRLQVDVVPGGFDTEYYRPSKQEHNLPVLVFVGNMKYLPNSDAMVHFCRDILPYIRRAIAGVEMWIVGINAPPEVKQLAGNGVHVTGRVDDVRPYYERSTVCVFPLRAGGGARLKILEAMALNRAVVSTSIGCEGRDFVDGEHLLVADSPEQFADKTILLLKDPALRERITAKAREFVVARYDWDIIAKHLIRILGEVAKSRQFT